MMHNKQRKQPLSHPRRSGCMVLSHGWSAVTHTDTFVHNRYQTNQWDPDRSNHWCMLMLGFASRIVHYYDPLGKDMPPTLVNALKWLLKPQVSWWRALRVESLPGTLQLDGYNCGVFCISRMRHAFNISTILHSQQEISLVRMKMFVETCSSLGNVVSLIVG